MTEYETKDSGQHLEYNSGMRRDSQDGKPRFDLIRTKLQPYEEQMIYRYAMLLARGAEKYSARNWEEGNSEEELERAKASLLRHTEQLVAGETDEDHAAAVWFNTQAIEYFRWRLDDPYDEKLTPRESKAARECAENINQLALQKAAQIRRRTRIHKAAQEEFFPEEARKLDWDNLKSTGLTVEAENVSPETVDAAFGKPYHQSLPGDSGFDDGLAKDANPKSEDELDPLIFKSLNGTEVRRSHLLAERDRGAQGLFQFIDAPWPTYEPRFSRKQALTYEDLLGKITRLYRTPSYFITRENPVAQEVDQTHPYE